MTAFEKFIIRTRQRIARRHSQILVFYPGIFEQSIPVSEYREKEILQKITVFI